MGNKVPQKIKDHMVDFPTLLNDIQRMNQMLEDPRYQRRVGFKIQMEIGSSNIPILSLFKKGLWKRKNMVWIVATISPPSVGIYNGQIKYECCRNIINELQIVQQIDKVITTQKFYFLFD